MKKIFILFALCLLLAGFSAQAQAAPLVGIHEEHDVKFTEQVITYTINIPQDGVVYIFTSNSNIDVGLYLWDSAGQRISSTEDACFSSVTHWQAGTDSLTTTNVAVKDAVFEVFLEAGEYKVSVTPTIDNFDATDDVFSNLNALLAYRNAVGNSKVLGKTSLLNVVYQQSSAVPIPASALLLAPGLAAIGVLRRKIS